MFSPLAGSLLRARSTFLPPVSPAARSRNRAELGVLARRSRNGQRGALRDVSAETSQATEPVRVNAASPQRSATVVSGAVEEIGAPVDPCLPSHGQGFE